MEYLGWETPVGQFLLIFAPKSKLQLLNLYGFLAFGELQCLAYR
jgi:hypothetical protein